MPRVLATGSFLSYEAAMRERLLETATRVDGSLGRAVLHLLPNILILPSEQRIIISKYLDYLLWASRLNKFCDPQVESFCNFVWHGAHLPPFSNG
jgi:hypothetical protein